MFNSCCCEPEPGEIVGRPNHQQMMRIQQMDEEGQLRVAGGDQEGHRYPSALRSAHQQGDDDGACCCCTTYRADGSSLSSSSAVARARDHGGCNNNTIDTTRREGSSATAEQRRVHDSVRSALDASAGDDTMQNCISQLRMLPKPEDSANFCLRRNLEKLLDGIGNLGRAMQMKRCQVASDAHGKLMALAREEKLLGGGGGDGETGGGAPVSARAFTMRLYAYRARIYLGLGAFSECIDVCNKQLLNIKQTTRNDREGTAPQQQQNIMNPLAGSSSSFGPVASAYDGDNDADAEAGDDESVFIHSLRCELLYIRGKARSLLAASDLIQQKQDSLLFDKSSSSFSAAAASSSSSSTLRQQQSSSSVVLPPTPRKMANDFIRGTNAAAVDIHACVNEYQRVMLLLLRLHKNSDNNSNNNIALRDDIHSSVPLFKNDSKEFFQDVLLLQAELSKRVFFHDSQRVAGKLFSEFCDFEMDIEAREFEDREERKTDAKERRRMRAEERQRAEQKRHQQQQQQRSSSSSSSQKEKFSSSSSFSSVGGGGDVRRAYEVLGLDYEAGATQDEIKHKYRMMSLKWHPDRWSGSDDMGERRVAEEKMKEVNQAMEILRN